MIGFIIIAFFVLMAVFAPELGQNNPVTATDLATPLSPPAWAVIFPQYRDLIPTYSPLPSADFNTKAAIGAWTLSGQNYTTSFTSVGPVDYFPAYTGSMLLNASITPRLSIWNSSTPNPQLPYGEVFFSMSRSFKFDHAVGQAFNFGADVTEEPLTMVNVSDIYFDFIISGPTGNWSLASVNGPALQPQIDVNTNALGQGWNQLTVDSALITGTDVPGLGNATSPSAAIFNKTGTYTLTMELQAVPCQPGGSPYSGSCVPGTNTSVSMLISEVDFHIDGGAYGLLGTDSLGRDVWSEFVWGSQVSLEIGISAGVGAVALGTIIGLASGYLGGIWDEILSRGTDFVLVLPFLPLLIVLSFIIQQNPALSANVYEWIIFIFIIISWPAITKIIRSQVLTVKERQYVEASRAVGGGTWHIIRKHILPNVMGLVYSQVALNVAGFILLEAALDFLAISIHSIFTMTWGIMLTQALPFAVTASNNSYVWWWFLPPGIAIASLSLAFVLVGFALDSIFNPRLRAR